MKTHFDSVVNYILDCQECRALIHLGLWGLLYWPSLALLGTVWVLLGRESIASWMRCILS